MHGYAGRGKAVHFVRRFHTGQWHAGHYLSKEHVLNFDTSR